MRRALAAVGIAVAVGLLAGLLAGCSQDPLAQQYREGSGKNYIAGDGTIAEYAPANREASVHFQGNTTAGGTFDSKSTLGKVTVVNFWYAGCAPCRAEAPILKQAERALPTDTVTFIGVNVRDQRDTAVAFERGFGVTYPSILDVADGAAQLAFAGKVSPAAVPTTLVLDRSGRVAARILGQLSDATILTAIVNTVLGERS